MITDVIRIFSLNAATGIAASLLLMTPRNVGAQLFRLNAMIAAIVLLIALYFAPARGPYVVMVVLCVAYASTVLWLPPLIERGLLIGAVGLGGWLLWQELIGLEPKLLWPVGAYVGLLSGGIVTGLAVVAMNLGHSYLAMAKLPIQPLRRVTLVLGALIVWRGAWLLVAIPILLVFYPEAPRELSAFFGWEDLTMVSLGLMRLLFGLVGPFVLTCLAWDAVRIRSTQSATGILYPVLVMVLIGEVSAIYLTFTTALPL